MHLHTFIPSNKEGYEICSECGSYHSVAAKSPKEIYEQGDYWTHENGRSKLSEQRWNLTETKTCGISKVEKILQYIPEGIVLEIGANPGVLLELLMATGREAYGIEPDPALIGYLKDNSGGATIIEGYFPDVFLEDRSNIFDCIVAMDVVEHAPDYDRFVRAAYRLLRPGGIFIFMSPIIKDGQYQEKDFKADEHVWILSYNYANEYLNSIFREVKFDTWVLGHEIFINYK